ncbi:MAG: flippase-like domain-containing protein [Gaiella sp.]|nr:flippase-like domain-containing protein [Gaiella sp.]
MRTGETARHVPARLFASSRGRRRFRRATDVFLLVPSLLGLGLVVATYPPSAFERSLIRLLATLPGWLGPLWELLYDGLALAAVVLVVAALVCRRSAVLLQAAAAVVLAIAITVAAARLAIGDWPDLGEQLRLRVDGSTFPLLRVALAATVILAVVPHLVRPLQRVTRWVLALGLVGAMLVEAAAPSATLAAFLVSLTAATAVRLALGTSAGHPETDDVVAALAGLGIEVARLEPADRQPAGVFVARGVDASDDPLLVKVYGRDAYDTQLLEKVWRTALYADDGPRLRRGRLEAAEHEALVTLLARQAGVPTRDVVVAAESSNGDALLVFRDVTAPLGADVTDDLLERAWRSLVALGGARIAHHRLEPDALALLGGDVALVDLDRATIAAGPEHILVDRAQLLATSAALAGIDRAVTAAAGAIGAERLSELLPYLQPAGFGSGLARALRAAEIDVDELRERTAAAAGVEAPSLVKLRRVTWGTLLQVALLALAVSAVIGGLSGLDYADLASLVRDASWGWIAAGFFLAQMPRLTQALSTLGSVPARIPFVPVYLMQLATGYLNLALPSNLARMALNIRFFQRHGVPPATAVTAGAIDSFVSTIAQAVLLAVLLLFSEASLDFGLETPAGPPTRALLAVVAVGLAGVAIVALVRRLREAIAERVRRWWPDVRATLVSLRAGNKLGLLLGGSVGTELLFAVSLGVFANALGYDVSLANLLLINISVSLLATFVPVPGGIGVTEFGLTVGLTAAGMQEEAALAAVVLYRVSTFYLPPVWGFFAMRWLQRSAHL